VASELRLESLLARFTNEQFLHGAQHRLEQQGREFDHSRMKQAHPAAENVPD
jgi:hypothetical protein